MRAILFVVLCSEAACASGQKTAAETAYTADLLMCVEEAGTRAEAEACRKRVQKQWGVAKDAGGE